jgi:hypothetical protein
MHKVRSRGIIVAVQVGAVKKYVAAMEASWMKERQVETQHLMHKVREES